MATPPNTDNPHHTGLFTRDEGHLTELTAHRLRNGELSKTERETVEMHLEGCALCQARLAQLENQMKALAARPLFAHPPDFAQMAAERQATSAQATGSKQTAEVAERPTQPSEQSTERAGQRAPFRDPPKGPTAERQTARRAWGGRAMRWAASVAAACAVVLVSVVWFGRGGLGIDDGDQDTIRIKGSSLGFEVRQAQPDGGGTRLLAPGDVVHPGATLGFVVQPKQEGYVLVVGVDATHSVYPCAHLEGKATRVQPRQGGIQLPGAVELDAVMGSELFVAVQCTTPFTVADVAGPLEAASRRSERATLPPLRKGCAQEQIAVIKKPRDGGGEEP